MHKQLDEERNRVLIVTGNVDSGTIIKNTIESIKFRTEVTDAPEKAIEIIRSTNISILFVDFSVDLMAVHQYVCWLPPDIRRNIIYVLVGNNFHTLYDLEALSYSANLVINTRDLQYLEKIFLKVATDHQRLFSPILDMLKVKKITG